MAEETQTLPQVNGHNVLDVCVVGAGPAGLMLADNLARFGISKTAVIDERATETTAGRADGLQPKTIETLRMLRLADDLLRIGTKVYDITIWGYGYDNALSRLGRELHYPEASVDVLDPYILLCHQGMIESTFIRAMRDRGLEVDRNTYFETYQPSQDGKTLDIKLRRQSEEQIVHSKYLVGCDGAHSNVRKAMPGCIPEGSSSVSVWGVLDGWVKTEFPDIWSKTIVVHPVHGAVLIVPRERGMTRFYIELKADTALSAPLPANTSQEAIMERAQLILAPYNLEWMNIEWFGHYQIGQRVASKFMDETHRVFIAGDASHTHSPKAAQGMNTSLHDSWNLAWKLNLELRGLAKPVLLDTYQEERRKIAQDLINFDYEHANQIAAGDSEALAENFRTNIGFMSGIGVKYGDNVLNHGSNIAVFSGVIRPGSILPPARAIRYVDHNPVHVQLDIPKLGQFKIYFLVGNVAGPAVRFFLGELSDYIASETSLLARVSNLARESYIEKPRLQAPEDLYYSHERYLTVSDVFTVALITATAKQDFEIVDLPQLFSASPWTVYLDDSASMDSQATSCMAKWLGDLAPGEVAIINVRPDDYVGSVSRWNAIEGEAEKAAEWLLSYYDGFLQA
ncbi:unnamed protein product [Clonostachys rosea]|uniref:FAD-binding domain-containing protein n=1 Tax=Bionectria ochroleuca TaxID=29856 RepID=A0ABY6UK92_BIOOC|nr:unnamed protein product [Clonostachys rosea]